jgi:cysteine desulfurase NifS
MTNKLTWKKGICGICPAGCWVKVGMNNGELVAIEADTGHPLGMICRRGQYAPEIIYSEHRLKYPLKRKGKKGTYDFERISWDKAYDIIVDNLEQIKKESGPETVAIYTGRGAFELSLCDIYQPKGVAVSSASSVLFPFGSPNTMGVGALCYVSFAMIAPHVTMGRMLVNMFTDIENADLLVVWGANPATDSPPLDMYRLEAAARRGASIIVIDPRKTETVYQTSAQWLPIRPGTDGALALSMINVLIDEDIYDDVFADKWTHGFPELKQYIQHFSPEVVQSITGVSAETIRSLARKIAGSNGSCPVMYTGLEYSNSGIQAIRAVLSLFALAGHLDVPGGIGLAVLNSHFPINRSCNQANPDLDRAVARDKFPIYSQYRGESHASGLVTSVQRGEPYKIRGLIIHGASLLTSWPQTGLWRQTLEQLDFQVCIDRQMTADAAFADIILPATTMFEIESYMTYGPIFRWREKLIEPVGEARNDYLIMAELARRLGYGDLYPQSEGELLKYVLRDSGFSLEDVKRNGGWVKIPIPMMEYKKWEKGGLRHDGKPGFETPTGKFEIWSTTLDDSGYEPLPKYTEPVEGPQADPELSQFFPLVFNSGARPNTDFRSQHHGIKGLLKDNPEPTVEINIHDAAARNIKDGDLVEVRTKRGAIPFRARATENIVQGAVECNMGGGTPVGPKSWREWNVNELTDLDNYDEISGFPVYKALLCDVARIKNSAPFKKSKQDTKIPKAQHPLFSVDTSEKKKIKRIYLDNNATTELLKKVEISMRPYMKSTYGNPSALHQAGRDAREGLDNARRQVASLINARPKRIIFTGCGSEADNLALKGTIFSASQNDKHLITSKIEHPAILKTCTFLEKIGCEITYLDVDAEGLIDPESLRRAVRPDTVLISIMMANNEVGTLLPIKELCTIAHENGIIFHTDAVQAAGKIPIDVEALDVDILTLSAHKFHGPKGIGALYVKKGVVLEPLIHGGKQENGLRAGTENIAGIIGMGTAAEIAKSNLKNMKKIEELRDTLEKGILEIYPQAVINGHKSKRLPNTLNMTLRELRGESLVIALDQYGISLSSGSACKSGSPDPTHVLLAMGRTAEEAHCSVRFSLSHKTKKSDITTTLKIFRTVLEETENTIRFLPCK